MYFRYNDVLDLIMSLGVPAIGGWNKMERKRSNDTRSEVLACSVGSMRAPTTLGNCYIVLL